MRHLICVTVLLAALIQSAPAAEKPNFILMVTDDQRADCLSCAGHSHLKTPNIDRLATAGVKFDNAFVTTAICCVSRASIMTGLYARKHKVPDFGTPLPPEVLANSFPALLKKNGYRLGGFGKWGIGGEAPKNLFDEWDAWGGQGSFFHKVDGQQIHNTEYLSRQAEKFLDGCTADQPFCLVIWYKGPHDPFLPDLRDEKLFAGVTFPTPKTYNDDHFAKLPEFIQKSEGRTRLKKRHPTPEVYQEFVRQYLRCVASIDRSVGRILDKLDSKKLADDTMVIFTSDHGFFLGEHGMSGKWLAHEESIRVPLLIRYPKLPEATRGKSVSQIALNVDIAPTILDAAGVEIPAGTDGGSLRGLLETGAARKWREDFFYEHHFPFRGRIPRTEAVRNGRWKYITYQGVDPAFEELYDLSTDPLEEHNLAADPKQQKQLALMRDRYQKWVGHFGPPVLPVERPAKRKTKQP